MTVSTMQLIKNALKRTKQYKRLQKPYKYSWYGYYILRDLFYLPILGLSNTTVGMTLWGLLPLVATLNVIFALVAAALVAAKILLSGVLQGRFREQASVLFGAATGAFVLTLLVTPAYIALTSKFFMEGILQLATAAPSLLGAPYRFYLTATQGFRHFEDNAKVRAAVNLANKKLQPSWMDIFVKKPSAEGLVSTVSLLNEKFKQAHQCGGAKNFNSYAVDAAYEAVSIDPTKEAVSEFISLFDNAIKARQFHPLRNENEDIEEMIIPGAFPRMAS